MTAQPEHKQAPKPQDSAQTEPRRYLVNIDSISTPQLFTDCLVIGGGIAGLRAAIEAAENCTIISVPPDRMQSSEVRQCSHFSISPGQRSVSRGIKRQRFEIIRMLK